MILSNVNIGTGPSSGDGSPLRSAFSIINNNFQLITNNVNALTNSVSSVAGRTGNIILTVNDVLGAASIAYVNSVASGNANIVITPYDNSNVKSYLSSFNGNIIPSANVTYSLGNVTHQWKDLWVSNATIYLNSVPLSLGGDNTLLVNNVPVVTFVDGNLSVGGNVVNSAVVPYIELTNDPFITQPVILGNVVSVTAAAQGINAQFQVEILEGPVLGNVTVQQPGSGYTAGQRYQIPYFNIGGSTANSTVILTVDTIDGSGGISTVANVQFAGTPDNSVGSYGNLNPDYLPSVFDAISANVILTRDNVRGLFNSAVEQEYNNSTYASPVGTLWNNDGWGDLTNLRQRSFSDMRSALNGAIGENIIGAELVMLDTANDQYYKFSFSAWGQNNGAYAYTRNLITDPNYFEKLDYGDQIDIIVPDDGEGSGVGITRGENNGIYNPYREEGWDENVSPAGTQWNLDGWDDLSNVTTRTYTNFYDAYGNGGLGNKVPGSQAVMYVPDSGKYYAIQWINWTQGNNGGGFSYTRKELDLTKLNEGVKFPDGTVLKSAAGVGRVKATASGSRRIEEVTGNKTVSVTQVVTNNLTTVASRSATNSQLIWIDSTTTTIDDILDNPANYGNAYGFEFSLNDITWYPWGGSTSFSGDERGYSIFPTQVSYNQGDIVYFRYKTGGESVIWWDKADLPGGASNFRGAVIDYHAYSGEATWIGTIHIVSDTGNDYITHTEVNSGTSDAENDDLWVVQNEGQIQYRRIDGEAKTLKVQWTAKVFYGSEFYD